MAKLRVPSLQHLARNSFNDPGSVCRALVALAKNSPTFSYASMFGAVRDMLLFKQPYDEVAKGIMLIKREDVRDNFLELLPLLRDHFESLSPAFVQAISPRFYPIGRGLLVPFEPPLVYSCGSQLYFPWLIFWRSNPLSSQRLALFVTIVREILSQDPDFENARFQILDFSAPNAKTARTLAVTEASEIPDLSEGDKRQLLDAFAEGYFRAQSELTSVSATADRPSKPENAPPDEQPNQLEFKW